MMAIKIFVETLERLRKTTRFEYADTGHGSLRTAIMSCTLIKVCKPLTDDLVLVKLCVVSVSVIS